MDSDWDVLLIRKTFSNETSREPGALLFRAQGRARLPVELQLDRTYEGDGLIAYFDALYKAKKEPGHRKHHALDDARALRAAILAVEDAVRRYGAV